MRGQNSSLTQLRATSTSTPARRRSPFSRSDVVSPRCRERTASRLRLGRSHPCGMRTSACPRGSSGTEQLYNGDCPPRNVCCSRAGARSEEHTSELQSQSNLVCRLLLEKKKKKNKK